MNAQEAINVCRYVRAACPQQAMDEFTPQAWADLLGDVRYEDAQEAVRVLVKRQPFVAPAEIRNEIKSISRKRLEKFGTADLPSDMPNSFSNPNASVEEMREIDRAYFRYTSCIYQLVGEGVLTRDDPQPSYAELKPLIDAKAQADDRSALEAAQARKDKLTERLEQVAANLQLTGGGRA